MALTKREYVNDVTTITAENMNEIQDEVIRIGDALDSGELKGEKGESGVYVGTGDMPDGCNVQIDPEGTAAPFFEEITPDNTKNLCDIGTITFERSSGYLDIGSTLEEGKTYTLSAEVSSTDTDSATGLCAIYLATSKNVMLDPKYTITRGARASVTFVCPATTSPVSKIVFYASGSSANSTGDTATFANIQIEEGSVATPYIPAKVLTAIDYIARNKIGDIVTKTKWLAIGDSITFGVYSYMNGYASASGETDGWVRRLASALRYDITVMASRGMGYTAAVTGQDPLDKTQPRISLDTLLTRIEDLTDDFNLITLAFGINDYATSSQATVATVEAGLDNAVQRLMAKFPTARLVVITPFNSSREGNASTNYAYGQAKGGRSLKEIADAIKAKCESYGIECIYATNGFLINNFNINTLLPDATHPSDYGHTLIAKNMAHYLFN
jgi:lysophospholipase L1-like esterase